MTDHREVLLTTATEHSWRPEVTGRYLQFRRDADRISVDLAQDGMIRKAVWANREVNTCGHPVAMLRRDDSCKLEQVTAWLRHVVVRGEIEDV